MGAVCNGQQDIEEELRIYNQSHLIKHMKSINDQQKKQKIIQQLKGICLPQIMNHYGKSIYKSEMVVNIETSKMKQKTKDFYFPINEEYIVKQEYLQDSKQQLTAIGKSHLQKNQVAVFLMAGKNQSHSDYDKNIAMYDIGMDSACSLFQILIYRLNRLCQIIFDSKTTQKIKVYIMLSQGNKKQVIQYFKSKNYMGYGSNNIFFFSQKMSPLVDIEGKILLKSFSQIWMAPSGNGQIFSEIERKKIIKHLEDQKIKFIYFAPINNILLKICDPKTLGYLVKYEQQIVSMCIKKQFQGFDDFGFIGSSKNGRPLIYENISQNEEAKFVNAGSCFMTLDFIKKIIKENQISTFIDAKRHVRRYSNMSYLPATKELKVSEGLSFELFYHHIFQLADKLVFLQIKASQQFHPIRNFEKNHKFSLKSAREALWSLHRNWAQKSGWKIVGNKHIEFSPGLSYEGEGINQILLSKGYQNKEIKTPAFISI